jgi:hypothetical protein
MKRKKETGIRKVGKGDEEKETQMRIRTIGEEWGWGGGHT